MSGSPTTYVASTAHAPASARARSFSTSRAKGLTGEPARRATGHAARLALGAGLALAAVGYLQLLHVGAHEEHEIAPLLHWLRDALLAFPLGVGLVWMFTGPRTRRATAAMAGGRDGTLVARALWAALVAVPFALGSIPGNALHARLFGAHHDEGMSFLEHASRDASAALVAAFAFLVSVTLISGVPWRAVRARPPAGGRLRAIACSPLRALAHPEVDVVVAAAVLGLLALLSGSFGNASAGAAEGVCRQPGVRLITADVVALDQRIEYNRLGVTAPAGMMFALRRDVVPKSGDTLAPGNVKLRADKRPRPLTLRMNVGDCLQINFQNLLAPADQRADADQPADRHVGIHVKGLLTLDGPAAEGGGIAAQGGEIGRNSASGLVAPGESAKYTLYGEHENTYLLEDLGVTTGFEGGGGTSVFGLFGAVNVEPYGSVWYRSQVTRDEMDVAASAWTGNDTDGWAPTPGNAPGDGVRKTAQGQPVVNYDAVDAVGTPVLNVLKGHEIVHSDLNAVVSGSPEGADGTLGTGDDYRIPARAYPRSYWDNQNYNMDDRRGQEPFREFTVIFHDEIKDVQAFPEFFGKEGGTPEQRDPKGLAKTLAGVKDGFAINYGTGGIGNEILANRLGVGPMWSCTECKYEEFFLTSWAVGDPAMIVDVPANKRDADGNVIPGPKATRALYPDDPSNVHHSYLNDRVKFRNLHAGPKEHHIFHLHTHQWQQNPNTKKSAYLDSQMIGPGAAYTYEIAFGGSGNRNKVVGDAIFHCHFYPHFAQGMWEFWRVHDTFERGTQLDADGRPAPRSRALPDGEIKAGTPIPAIVPLPNRPMAPIPGDAQVVPYDLDGDGTADSSQVDLDDDGIADAAQGFKADPAKNVGFPFFIPGLAGHRPPTPPMDIVDTNGDGTNEDGGLARHIITGGKANSFQTPLDMNKTLEEARISYLPENGTPAERAAMTFHAKHWHDTFVSDAKAEAVTPEAPLAKPWESMDSSPAGPATTPPIKGFETNGLDPAPGAPYAEPCRTDNDLNGNVSAIARNRRYKGAVVQFDATLNKMGWHFPQERILNLWDDVGPTLTGKRAPEPLVMRLDSEDCADYWHTNLVPNTYELDDYQVRTPTDIIGQHIHLVKFDVTSADGSGNGFNYEDGTLSPQEITERVNAVRAGTNAQAQDAAQRCDTVNGGNGRLDQAGETATPACPLAREHPFFKNVAGVGELAWGARTTVQRWYADPVLNQAWDRGLGAVFTHDHYGPSTHQQVGLYSTVLVEPKDSKWRVSDDKAASPTYMGSRHDGGPTSWKADIVWDTGDATRDKQLNQRAHREFYFEFADFQHAYQAGGATLHKQDNGAPDEACGPNRERCQIPSYADFKNAINPPQRQEPPAGREADLYWSPPVCANGLPRPCPEAISADDPGTYVVNYRNEPAGLRVYDPVAKTQAGSAKGNLALAFQSRTDRAIKALNAQPSLYPPLTPDVAPGDPWTPMMRTYMGDRVRVRAQIGATEEGHNITIHGIKWLAEALNADSGWRDSQPGGISEYFNLEAPVPPDTLSGNPQRLDYLYTMGAAKDDLWNGIWGLLRTYSGQQGDLKPLPNNPNVPVKGVGVTNAADFSDVCRIKPAADAAPVRTFNITAVRAADVMGAQGLVYNSRTTDVKEPDGTLEGSGPLTDPAALMYVPTADLVTNSSGKPTGLKSTATRGPLVLRANAGDCIKVNLKNALPTSLAKSSGYDALPAIVHKDENVNGGIVSFNANDLAPSSSVGLHPQLVAYSMRKADGFVAGGNDAGQLVGPGGTGTYTWYAGDVDAAPADTAGNVTLKETPIEFGAINLMPADRFGQSSRGLVGALVIEPKGSTWPSADAFGTSATITMANGDAFRDLVTVLQDDVNLRYSRNCTPTAANLNCAVPGVASEGPRGAGEDPEDSGQKAINYGSEPLWFRLGLAPGTPFGSAGYRENPLLHKVFSNALPGVGADPRTPVLTAPAGTATRFRILQPAGHGRNHVFDVGGHAWQRQPADSDELGAGVPRGADSGRIGWTEHSDPTTLNADGDAPDGEGHTVPVGEMTGHNMRSWWIGAQEGIGPSSHYDAVIPRAGGVFCTQGDYLFRDSASFGQLQGLWGLFRVGAPDPKSSRCN